MKHFSLNYKSMLGKTRLNSSQQPQEAVPTSWLQNSPLLKPREELWRPSEAALHLQFSRCSATAGHPAASAAPLLSLPGLGLHLRQQRTEEVIRWKLSCTLQTYPIFHLLRNIISFCHLPKTSAEAASSSWEISSIVDRNLKAAWLKTNSAGQLLA